VYGVTIDLPTRADRDDEVGEMPEVTAYFEKHPEHERFRAEVNRSLNAKGGGVRAAVVRAVVRALEDEEERQS
jgi:hypothetical protein